MAKEVELDEPLIDFFRKANINAVHRVLERAQRNADKAAKKQARGSRVSGRTGPLTKALNKAMASYGRSAKDRASIRQTAPDTGGRPYHFGYSTVTKGESARGRAGQTGTPPKASKQKGRARGKSGAPTANTREAAHQVYTERDGAVEREAAAVDQDVGPDPAAGLARTTGREEPGTEVALAERDRSEGREGADPGIGEEIDGEEPDLGPRRRRRPTETTRDFVEGLVAEGQGVSPLASEAAAQAYIEDPAKVPRLMGTTASFGTIGETLEERMSFWDLVHEHESSKGGRTQSRLVLELPHEATARDRHEIVRRFTDEFRRKGIPFWASIHMPTKENDARNHHAHVVFTDRPMRRMPHPETGATVWDFTVAETYKSSSRNKMTRFPYRQNRDPEMRDRGYVKLSRARFSDVVNEVMAASGNAVRYDPRSYKDMGLDVAPMRNVTRILADKLDKRTFVVMDAEWTRKMIDAEIQAAATRRDATFVKLQEVEVRMQQAARNAHAATMANDRLPKHLRLTPGRALGRGAATAVMDKILAVRRDRLATKFVDEATLSALRQVAEATSPTQGRRKAARAYNAATAPDPADLAALHEAAVQEMAEHRRTMPGRMAQSRMREDALARKWRGEAPGSGGGGSAPGPTPGPQPTRAPEGGPGSGRRGPPDVIHMPTPRPAPPPTPSPWNGAYPGMAQRTPGPPDRPIGMGGPLVGRRTTITPEEEPDDRASRSNPAVRRPGIMPHPGSLKFAPGSMADRVNRTAKAYMQTFIEAVDGAGADLGTAFDTARQKIVEQAAARRAAAEAEIARMSTASKARDVAPTPGATSRTHAGPRMQGRDRTAAKAGVSGDGGRTSVSAGEDVPPRSPGPATRSSTNGTVGSRPDASVRTDTTRNRTDASNDRSATVPGTPEGPPRVVFGARLTKVRGKRDETRRTAPTETAAPPADTGRTPDRPRTTSMDARDRNPLDGAAPVPAARRGGEPTKQTVRTPGRNPAVDEPANRPVRIADPSAAAPDGDAARKDATAMPGKSGGASIPTDVTATGEPTKDEDGLDAAERRRRRRKAILAARVGDRGI